MSNTVGRTPTVLVIDDEQSILDVIRILLDSNGFTDAYSPGWTNRIGAIGGGSSGHRPDGHPDA